MNSENVTAHRKAIVAYKHRKSRESKESKVFCVKAPANFNKSAHHLLHKICFYIKSFLIIANQSESTLYLRSK